MGTQTEAFRVADSELWNEPELLSQLRACVLEWYVELQNTKPQTPSLSQHSFCRRLCLARDKHHESLEELQSATLILSYGCKLLSSDSNILDVFVWSFVERLGEARTESTASAAGKRPTEICVGDEVRSASAGVLRPVFKKLKSSEGAIELD